uniref:Paralemmin-1 n=1 Tax=Hucho hucho TaxID=62062 RepID=A0A4W5QBQ0_9TELE
CVCVVSLQEKRMRQTEIENKRRQLEDDRRQLQHLKSKALRERWLLDGAPEEDETQRRLQEDEEMTKALEKSILCLEQEIEELENPVVTKENGGAVNGVSRNQSPRRELTGVEAKLLGPSPDQASAENPVTLVFMGYTALEGETAGEVGEAGGTEGGDGSVKAEFVMLPDGEGKGVGEGETETQSDSSCQAAKTTANTNHIQPTDTGESVLLCITVVVRQQQPTARTIYTILCTTLVLQ